jgi:hypothetical protein
MSERDPSPNSLRPVDGEFKLSDDVRVKWCRENGHPQAFLNLSLSAKDKQRREHFQCLCGSVKSVREKDAATGRKE